VPVPRLAVRSLLVVGLLVAAVFAAVGGLALRAPGVVAVGVAGLLAGLTAAAIAHDAPAHTLRTTVEAAAMATAGTVGVLLVVSGTAALLGGPITVGLLASAVLVWLLRSGRRRDDGASQPHPSSAQGGASDVVALTRAVAPVDAGPVAALSTEALGREWLRTSAALQGRLAAAARRSIVERREATLDELERRDPAGFARWMSTGPGLGSDPAAFVRGGPVAGTEAA
jgi:hypothetical protein